MQAVGAFCTVVSYVSDTTIHLSGLGIAPGPVLYRLCDGLGFKWLWRSRNGQIDRSEGLPSSSSPTLPSVSSGTSSISSIMSGAEGGGRLFNSDWPRAR